MINYGYFRHRFDAHENIKLNRLVDDIGVSAYGYYYTLLEIYGAHLRNNPSKNEVQIHLRVIANMWRKRVDSCKLVLTKLQLSDLLVVTLADSTCTIAIPNYSKYYGSYKKTPIDNAPKESKVKESKVNIKASTKKTPSRFDFEAPYQSYPRKEGKKAAFIKLSAQITKQSDYDSLCKAVINYATHCKTTGVEKKYTKLFSTFVSSWEDWVDWVNEKDVWEKDMIKILGGTDEQILANLE